ncbi:GNAT family N-acetyltransferase [Chryseobacterium sp. SIMBA_029]|uniref:GNAT family N-acetyltransferase n=1 Tax=Chryseobacterium sp. SIMBA_029 TaxID=3085772 RepID=UPI00397A0895
MIDLAEEYILENDKILLRPLKESDFDLLLKFSEEEPDIWQFNALGANGAENLKNYITTALNNRQNQTEYPFVVFDKKDEKIIGSTRFYLINKFNQTLELGYTWYGKSYQGTYVNKNCKYLMLEFAFEIWNMERVGFRANNLNIRSISAMKSIGCKEEGILRNFSKDSEGNRIDAIVLSILKEEWFNSVKENLKEKI